MKNPAKQSSSSKATPKRKLTSRQKLNITMASVIGVIVVLLIIVNQRVYLPRIQQNALHYYYTWINHIGEAFIHESNFIIEASNYKKDASHYDIHGINVGPPAFSSDTNNTFYISDSLSFSLSHVMSNVIGWTGEENPVALVSGDKILWSSWIPTPVSEKALLEIAKGASPPRQHFIPEKVRVSGKEYFVFALSDNIRNVHPIQIFGLIEVDRFNQRINTLPIRRGSYLFTILLCLLLLVPMFKIVIIDRSEELKLFDFRFIVVSILLGAFLAGSLLGLFSYQQDDKKLFNERLEESSTRISEYLEQELSRVIGIVSCSKESLSSRHYGYLEQSSSSKGDISLTSVYQMNHKGEENANWTVRDTITMSNYSRRDYYKAFASGISNKPPVYRYNKIGVVFDTLFISFVESAEAVRPQNNSRVELIVDPSCATLDSVFFLETIASLIDGKIKNVISMDHGDSVTASSFILDKLFSIIHPPGYKYLIFDINEKVYCYSDVSEVMRDELSDFFVDLEEIVWRMHHVSDSTFSIKVNGEVSYCNIKRVDGFPDLFVMTYYVTDVRSEAQGQAWIKLLFIAFLLTILILILILWFKVKRLNFTLWLVFPMILACIGAFATRALYQFEIKQLEAWTLDEFCISKNSMEDHLAVFNIFTEIDSAEPVPICKRCNYLTFPGAVSESARKYRRLTKETGYTLSSGNNVTISKLRSKQVSVSALFDSAPFWYVAFGLILVMLIVYARWMRSYFILDKVTGKTPWEGMPSEEFLDTWNKLNVDEKYLLVDLAEDGIANLKNRAVVKSLCKKKIIVFKSSYRVPEVDKSIRKIILKQKAPEDDQDSQRRKSNWRKIELIIILSTFGIMILLSVFQENWLKSFIGIITLIATGIGAVMKLRESMKGSDNNSK